MLRTIPYALKLESATAVRDAAVKGAILPEHVSVFEFLKEVNRANNFAVTLRVAGGWVRDLMLGQPSHDIDIAIESPAGGAAVSGERFARAVSELQERKGERGRTVSVIRVNPELSKHIETATVCVCDIPVEFCALRTDDYSADSRIPTVRPATPDEDARRRDFTVNALFYNLESECIEDYTTGLADLQARVLRCPLEPRATFSDDPLRLLRGIRFVGQLAPFGFALDESVVQCVDPALLQTLQHKVSRERVGKEFWKMAACPGEARCVKMLIQLGLLQSIMLSAVRMRRAPGQKKGGGAEIDSIATMVDRRGAEKAAEDCATIELLTETALPALQRLNPLFAATEEHKIGFVCFELLIPELREVAAGAAADGGAALEALVYDVCVNGLKLPAAVGSMVRRMTESYAALAAGALSLGELSAAPLQDATKLKVMEALAPLHDRSCPDDTFALVLLCYVLLELRRDLLRERRLEETAALFDGVWRTLQGCPNLLAVHSMKLPMDGKAVRQALGLQPRQVGTALAAMRKLLLLRPDLTEVDDIVEALRTVEL